MMKRGIAKSAQQTALSANRLIRALNAYAEAPAEAESTIRRLIKKEVRRLVRCCIQLYLKLLIFAKKTTPTPVEENPDTTAWAPDTQHLIMHIPEKEPAETPVK